MTARFMPLMQMTEKELFAYVPDLVFHNLGRLTDPGYSHRFHA
ncbi:MAG: hypothetical protein U5K27_21175 [Desulfotignum sp.]|nr:hypothetical protein [Desulfotignum sp.]